MQWYLKKYGVDVGKKKKAAAKEEKQDVGGGAGSWWLQAMGCTFYKNIKSVASQMVMGLLCDWASQRIGHQTSQDSAAQTKSESITCNYQDLHNDGD